MIAVRCLEYPGVLVPEGRINRRPAGNDGDEVLRIRQLVVGRVEHSVARDGSTETEARLSAAELRSLEFRYRPLKVAERYQAPVLEEPRALASPERHASKRPMMSASRHSF